MQRMSLRESLGLGGYVSACASVIVVPVGIALRSWMVPVLAIGAIMVVCIVGWSILPRTTAGGVVAVVVAWCAGAVVGIALIAFGVYAIVTAEPHCVSSPAFECFDSAEEQRARTIRMAMLPIVGGAVLLIVLTVVGVRGLLDAYRGRVR